MTSASVGTACLALLGLGVMWNGGRSGFVTGESVVAWG